MTSSSSVSSSQPDDDNAGDRSRCITCGARCARTELVQSGWCYHGKGLYFCATCGCEGKTRHHENIGPPLDISHYAAEPIWGTPNR